jgi:hypothetical protein
VAELTDSPAYQVRTVDRVLGAATAPLGGLRRVGLGVIASRSAARVERERAKEPAQV